MIGGVRVLRAFTIAVLHLWLLRPCVAGAEERAAIPLPRELRSTHARPVSPAVAVMSTIGGGLALGAVGAVTGSAIGGSDLGGLAYGVGGGLLGYTIGCPIGTTLAYAKVNTRFPHWIAPFGGALVGVALGAAAVQMDPRFGGFVFLLAVPTCSLSTARLVHR